MRGEKFHGVPCINEGHGTLRYRSTGGCVACIQNAAEAKREEFKRQGKTYNPRKDHRGISDTSTCLTTEETK